MLDLMMTLVVPLTLGLVAVYAACRRVDVYDALIQGAGDWAPWPVSSPAWWG